MKRMWFQFVRKEEEPKDAAPAASADRSPSADDLSGPPAEPDDSPVTEDKVALRLTGELWLYPAGIYRPVVITGDYQELDDTTDSIKIFPACLNLDIGEARRLDGMMTRLRDDRFAVMERDLPVDVQVVSRTALVSLLVGQLLHDPTAFGQAEPTDYQSAHAHGTAVFRTVTVSGNIFSEAVRLRLFELQRVQLVQGFTGWFGRFFQCLPEVIEGDAGRALVRSIQGEATADDPLHLIRRGAQRYLRTAS